MERKRTSIGEHEPELVVLKHDLGKDESVEMTTLVEEHLTGWEEERWKGCQSPSLLRSFDEIFCGPSCSHSFLHFTPRICQIPFPGLKEGARGSARRVPPIDRDEKGRRNNLLRLPVVRPEHSSETLVRRRVEEELWVSGGDVVRVEEENVLEGREDDGLSFEVVVLGPSRILLSLGFDHLGSEFGKFDQLGRIRVGAFCFRFSTRRNDEESESA